MNYIKKLRAAQVAFLQKFADRASPNNNMAMTRFVKRVLGVQ